MTYPIEEKLVIAAVSSTLFQLDEADAVFREEGILRTSTNMKTMC